MDVGKIYLVKQKLKGFVSSISNLALDNYIFQDIYIWLLVLEF